MAKRVLGLVAALFAAALTFPAARAAAPGLQLVATKQIDSRLVELTMHTDALAADTHVRILLPAGYNPGATNRYPVLYLLHGALSDYTSWTVQGEATAITAKFPLIVVMPDGGSEGNYTNWYNFGAWGHPAWETYHIDQLIPWIDAHYRTVASRAGRAIAGLSMGGAGAVAYASLHPDLFSAVASFSGAVDTNNVEEQVVTGTGGIQSGKVPGAIFGERLTDEVRWRGHNGWDLAENLRGMFVEVDTGDGSAGGPNGNNFDPVEEGVHEQSLAFHDRLLALGIAHVWDDYGHGAHQFYYWNRDLTQFLPRLMSVFARPSTPPSVNYRTIVPQYSVFGWQVAIARPALEFSGLSDASATGFVLQGSGVATVTTPALYTPRAPLGVIVSDEQGTHSMQAITEPDGRLRLTLTLGTANPYQQYTLLARSNAIATATDKGLGYAPTRIVGGGVGDGTLVYLVRVSITPSG